MLTTQLAEARSTVPLTVRSAAFEGGKSIPDANSGYHDDLSPDLTWSTVPDGAKSIAILVEDPDAPTAQPFVHWMIANIPPRTTQLPAGVTKSETLPDLGNAVQGRNDKDRIGYYGPRPPRGHGVHHYHFQVFALDSVLDLQPGFSKEELQKALSGHVLAKGQIVGTYEAAEDDIP